ncbi:hypothetical protein Esti_002674 [Eimeria stiedai]
MAFLPILLSLTLLLSVGAAGELISTGAEQDSHDAPQQNSCPAYSGREEELSYFVNATTPAAKEPSASSLLEDATDGAKKLGAYVELTESALQFALEKQPLALVLYSNARCTDASPLAQAFVGVAKSFTRMSLLEPRPLFAKAVPEDGASKRKRGMRQGGDDECELFLSYRQQTPDATEEEGEKMALPLLAGSTDDEIKLQVIKLAFPSSLRAVSKQMLEELLFEFPRALVRFFLRPADITPVPTGLLVATSRVPIIDVHDPHLASLYAIEAPNQLLIGPGGRREVFALDANNEEEQARGIYQGLYHRVFLVLRIVLFVSLRLIRALEAEPATVLPLSSLTAPSIFTELRPVALFFGGAEPAVVEDFAFTEAAAAWGQTMAFCSSVRPSALQSRAIDYLGIREMPLPQVVIVSKIDNPKLTTKFICPDISSVTRITQCLTDFKNAKLAPYYKTAAPPMMQKGPVYELVASRFNSVVLDSAQEVLLLVYSPACPHSAIFMPVFEELAVRVANEEFLLVARLDGTANEVEGFTVPFRPDTKEEASENGASGQPDPVSVHGYPVVVFFAKKDPQQNTKVPIVYTGPRNADALRNFVISQTALQAHEDL